jgi:hypothetical protein
MLAPMFRWWDPSLLSMVEPYLRLLLFGALDEVCREFELWKWRRHYARRVKMPPEDAFHPMTRALGPIAAPAMAPLIASWPEPEPRRGALQLSLFYLGDASEVGVTERGS